jgi:formate dehydrogenase subunit delta
MDNSKLIRMANEIATFFRSYPVFDATAGISDHIRCFWSPAMRDALCARIATNWDGVDPLVVQAMNVRHEFVFRGSHESPIKKEISGPNALGEMESDAG